MKLFLQLILSVALVSGVVAQSPDRSQLSSTAGGKRVIDYFLAFNSGDEAKLKTFFSENITPESLKQRGLEPRLAFHRQVKNDFQNVSVKKVVSVSEKEIVVLAQSTNGGWISYTFTLDPATSKFASFGIEPAEAPAGETAPAPAYTAPSTRAELLTATDRLFSDLMASGAFSGVVMIAKDDRPLFTKAYGQADAERNIPNYVDTKFNIGSINKTFTRTAIGQLVAQGKLSFDDKLIKILPDYPNHEVAARITIGNLVTMTSGLGDIFNDKFIATDKGKIRSIRDYLPLFASDPLEFEPGAKNRYSNAGYVVLGLVIEKLSGKNYYDYVRENIFKPAGMADTDSFEIDRLPVNTAVGYMAGKKPNSLALPGRGSSAGGGYSTAADLLKFSTALRSKKITIPDDTGGFPAEFKGLGIAGGSEGVNALFITNGQTGYTIIVLSNNEPPSAERPGMQVGNWLKQIKE